MRVEVITPFRDINEDRLRRVGQVITVTKDRGESIIARGLGIIAPDLPEPKPKAKKRKKRKKAKKPAEDKAERPKEDKAEKPIEE